MGVSIGELFIALGFDVDDKKLKEFKSDIKDGLEGLLKISAAAAGAVYAINAFVEGSIRSSVALRNFRTETGLSIRELQEWQIAGTMANTSLAVDDVTASVKALSSSLSDVSQGNGPSGAFARLGIVAFKPDGSLKDAFQILEEVRKNYSENVKRFGGGATGVQTETNLLQQIGINPGLINAIKVTRGEFDQLYEGKMLGPDGQRRLIELGAKITDVKQRLELMKDEFAADWSGDLIRALDQVIPKLLAIGSAIKSIGVAAKEMAEYLAPFKWFILGGAVLLVIAMNPVAAAFAAILFILEQVGNYLRGLPSVIPDIERAFKRLADAVTQMFEHPIEFIREAIKGMKIMGDFLHGRQTVTDLGYDRIPPDFFKNNNFLNALSAPVSPNYATDKLEKQMTANNNLVMNNLYNIHSVEDTFAIADQIKDTQQKHINYSFSDVNNGVRY